VSLEGTPRGRFWQRMFAIVGIASAFAFFVLPGFLALITYRRWQRGETGTPALLIGWGVVTSPMWLYLVGLVWAGIFVGPIEM